MKVYIEVTWDNGINGEDIICIGATGDCFSLEDVFKDYFGNSAEIISDTIVYTKKGKLRYWLDN